MKFDDPNLTPEEERLSAYLDGELSVDERQRVEQLLQENARFRKVLEEFKLLRGHLRELPSHVAPEWLTDAILERIGQLNGPATNGSDAPVIPSGANEPAPISHRTKWRGVMLAGMALAASLLVMLFVVSDSDSVVSQNSGDDRSTPSTASQSPADRAVTADALGSRQLVSSADEERQPELELANQPEEARSELSEFESLVESPRPGRPPEMQSAPFQSAAIESAEESRESASVPRAQSVELLSEADRVATKENQLLGAARQLPAPQAALPAIEFTESSPETGAISGFSNELQRVADRHQADVVVLIAGTIDSSFNNAQLYRVDRAHSFARGPTAREGASLTAPPDADRASSQQAEQPVDTRYRMQARRLNSEADDIAATPTEFDGAYRVMRVEHTNESLRQALAALTERSADRQQVDVFVASSDMSPSVTAMSSLAEAAQAAEQFNDSRAHDGARPLSARAVREKSARGRNAAATAGADGAESLAEPKSTEQLKVRLKGEQTLLGRDLPDRAASEPIQATTEGANTLGGSVSQPPRMRAYRRVAISELGSVSNGHTRAGAELERNPRDDAAEAAGQVSDKSVPADGFEKRAASADPPRRLNVLFVFPTETGPPSDETAR